MIRRMVWETAASWAIAPSTFAPGWKYTLMTLMPLSVCDSMVRTLSTTPEMVYSL